MTELLVDNAQVEMFARSISRFDWSFDRFDEPLLYPEVGKEPRAAANFFFFLVAIDHRTHPAGGVYAGELNGTWLTGAELLWALAKRRLDADPGFFSPERLSTVSADDIVELFHVTEPKPVEVSGPSERAALLRDCATRLMKEFDGSILNLVSVSGNWLCREDGNGLLQLLKHFEAYEDPMNKKSFLLVKFLERRHFMDVKDPSNLHVPVDNILLRLALRTGIVKLLNDDLNRKIRSGSEISQDEHAILREFTLEAFDKVASLLKMNATHLDDILWEFGRTHCHVPKPICETLPDSSERRCYRMIKSGPVGECPFGQGCIGYKNEKVWELKEPNFKTVFY